MSGPHVATGDYVRRFDGVTYTWTLKADARDGSGTVTDVTGLAAATGTVKVKW
ncbi:MAG: hypothetical protein QM619_03325 [Micropruina sp.]|uniref:hypothetical protein n=1 Tax=Micropruina sp. TaxID=2737536 RepID=UPI0039E3393E